MNERDVRNLVWVSVTDGIDPEVPSEVTGWEADSGFEVMYDVEKLTGGRWVVSLDALHIADFDTADAAKAYAQQDFISRVTTQFVCGDRGVEASLHRSPASKILEHKWLDPQCVNTGCQSLLLKQRADRAEELADKYKWQVRDTCARAEKAEAALAAPYRAGLERALDLVIDVAIDGDDVPIRWFEDVIRDEIKRLTGGISNG